MKDIFIDIEKELKSLSKKETLDRALEFQNKISGIYLYAIGGFPIKEIDGVYTLLGKELNEEFISNNLKEALGLSGMLTYMNKSDLSLEFMGDVCFKLNHKWANNWITLSFLVCVPNSKNVEKSLLRDSNFYESWTVTNEDLNFFGISGSVKNFMKFIKNKDDISFDFNTRCFMKEMDEKFKFIWNL